MDDTMKLMIKIFLFSSIAMLAITIMEDKNMKEETYFCEWTETEYSNEYKVGCERVSDTIIVNIGQRKSFSYCPYCGKEIFFINKEVLICQK